MDGVGFAGGEEGGDEGAAIGGEELDGEEENDGEEEEAQRAEKLRYGFGDGLALIPNKERHYHHDRHHHRQKNPMRCCPSLSFWYHTLLLSRLMLWIRIRTSLLLF